MRNTWNETQKDNKKHRISKYSKSPSYCKQCDSPLSYKQRRNKFCSQRCNGLYGAKKRHQEKPKCKCCQAEVKYLNRLFCSNKCQVAYNWAEKKKEAKKTGYAPAHQAMAKRLILQMRKHICSICKKDKWLGGPIPLVLDHISGNNADWRLDNLRLVCGNCNMLLPTFTSKNKGNGRKYHREYYHKRGGFA